MQEQFVSITADEVELDGILMLPERPVGVVLFAHGASPDGGYRNAATQASAIDFVRAGLATLCFDQAGVAPGGGEGGHRYFLHADIVLLARQLEKALGWLRIDPSTRQLPCGLYGHGASAAAVMQLAAWRGSELAALAVCDAQVALAGKAALGNVRVPSLLIVSRARPGRGRPEPDGVCRATLRQATGTDRRPRQRGCAPPGRLARWRLVHPAFQRAFRRRLRLRSRCANCAHESADGLRRRWK